MATSTIAAIGIPIQHTVSKLSSNVGNISMLAYKLGRLMCFSGTIQISTAVAANTALVQIAGINPIGDIRTNAQGNLSSYALTLRTSGSNTQLITATTIPAGLYLWISVAFPTKA